MNVEKSFGRMPTRVVVYAGPIIGERVRVDLEGEADDGKDGTVTEINHDYDRPYTVTLDGNPVPRDFSEDELD